MGIIQTTKQLRPRHPRDYYPTPIELCRAALQRYKYYHPKTILDPGAGDGVWGKVARELWPDAVIIGVELERSNHITHRDCYTSWLYGDFTQMAGSLSERFDLIIGNPPYRLAHEFITTAFTLAEYYTPIAFLLRLAYMEGQKRYHFWQKHPIYYLDVLSRRPSYTGNGKTDATAYAMFHWLGDGGMTLSSQTGWLMWDYDK